MVILHLFCIKKCCLHIQPASGSSGCFAVSRRMSPRGTEWCQPRARSRRWHLRPHSSSPRVRIGWMVCQKECFPQMILYYYWEFCHNMTTKRYGFAISMQCPKMKLDQQSILIFRKWSCSYGNRKNLTGVWCTYLITMEQSPHVMFPAKLTALSP